jgi:hypothetical protein
MGINKLKRDEVLFWLWPVIAAIISVAFKAKFFLGTVLFLVIPSVYLSFKKKEFVLKAIIFSLVGLLAFIVIDYIAVTMGQWYFPHSIFGYRLFGVVAFEGVFWTFALTYLIVMYYEYFLEKKCTPRLYYPGMKYVFIAFSAVLATFLIILNVNASLLQIPYFYLVFGIIMGVIPIVSVRLRFPYLFTNFVKTAIYFVFFSLVWELVGVPLGHWSFPGTQFIGWVELFGVRFPFEELFVWMILGAMAVLSWYEFFDEPRHK